MHNDKLILRVIELAGGKDILNERLDKKLNEINEAWNQNTDLIGRVLRAHLFVEHFMTRYILSKRNEFKNESVERASFARKVDLIARGDVIVLNELIPGIRRLNKIRNKLAHNLFIELDSESTEEFYKSSSFWLLRIELAKPNTPSMEPVAVIEDFAKHVGVCIDEILDPASLSKFFSQAISEQKNL